MEHLEEMVRSRNQSDCAVPVQTFRPNLLIDGPTPFEEDKWSTLRLGSLQLDQSGEQKVYLADQNHFLLSKQLQDSTQSGQCLY